MVPAAMVGKTDGRGRDDGAAAPHTRLDATLAFALSGTAHADQYGFNDASIVIAWQVQPAVLIFPADQGTLALDGGQATL